MRFLCNAMRSACYGMLNEIERINDLVCYGMPCCDIIFKLKHLQIQKFSNHFEEKLSLKTLNLPLLCNVDIFSLNKNFKKSLQTSLITP